MIVTTGRIIKIDDGDYHLERSSETPGIVTVQQRSRPATHAVLVGSMTEALAQIALPTNLQDMERFIAAYRRACSEDVGYRKTEVG